MLLPVAVAYVRILRGKTFLHNNYISPSSTVGIQLHVSALYVGHFQVVI